MVQELQKKEIQVSAPSAYLDTLPFDLVDIGVEYGEFKGKINLWEAGSK